MVREAAEARLERLHGEKPWHDGARSIWSEKQTPRTPYHYTHGMRVIVLESPPKDTTWLGRGQWQRVMFDSGVDEHPPPADEADQRQCEDADPGVPALGHQDEPDE